MNSPPKGIHPDMWTAILKQKQQGGIQLDRLPPDVHLVVKTRNSTYIIKPDKNGWLIQGGIYFPKETHVGITGSTWGGNTIKPNWIGKDMNLEIWRENNNRPVTTSIIKQAIIIFKDGKQLPIWDNS
ncbi:hypothetical protein LCGC14_2813880 [marine sediment metagenome]|uniref:Uncharacterized protein n=1 Tax=marine sediment metagenome TaxID=412755 RepID=A0A0F8Z5Y7_9ZZZZ